MDVQAVIVPGIGVAACQAGVDNTRANQMLVYRELIKGTDPEEILRMLSEDEHFQRRQFGILDMQGRSVGFSGENNRFAALHVAGRVGASIYYQVQVEHPLLGARHVRRRACFQPRRRHPRGSGSWPRWRPPTRAGG